MTYEINQLCNDVCSGLARSEYPNGSVAHKYDVQFRVANMKRLLSEAGSVNALALRSVIKRRFKNT